MALKLATHVRLSNHPLIYNVNEYRTLNSRDYSLSDFKRKSSYKHGLANPSLQRYMVLNKKNLDYPLANFIVIWLSNSDIKRLNQHLLNSVY